MSVAGTPQAREAVIANTIPQTATVKRNEATLVPRYDGEPQFKPIVGTPLQYAINSPTPVIRVGRAYPLLGRESRGQPCGEYVGRTGCDTRFIGNVRAGDLYAGHDGNPFSRWAVATI